MNIMIMQCCVCVIDVVGIFPNCGLLHWEETAVVVGRALCPKGCAEQMVTWINLGKRRERASTRCQSSQSSLSIVNRSFDFYVYVYKINFQKGACKKVHHRVPLSENPAKIRYVMKLKRIKETTIAWGKMRNPFWDLSLVPYFHGKFSYLSLCIKINWSKKEK